MTKRIKRLDGVDEVVTKQVELSKIVEPKFLTLTERPANQVAFKVVRDDTGGEPTMSEKSATGEVRRRRIRSTQRSSLLYIEFPEGTTMEQATEAMKEYGLEDYELEQCADGKVRCKRSDLSEVPSDAVSILIGDGRKAGIARADLPTHAIRDPMPHIAVVAIEFNKDSYATQDSVLEYLTRHDIDFLEKGIENTDTVTRVVRSEVSDDAEVRRVEVETGVVAVVARSAMMDTVDATPFIEVVSETAYGQWGWGQLDFTARMADVEFCECAEDASYTLRRVVEDILFYSQLPVSVRKELVNRAAAQFSAYIGSLLDALPAKVVLINRSHFEQLKEQASMTQKTDDKAGDTKRTDQDDQAAQAAAAQAAEDSKPVTRGELKSIIGEAVAAAMATAAPAAATPAQADDVQRSDDGKAADAGKGEGESNTLKAVEEVITRSVGGLADTMKQLGERLTAIEGATVVRSDAADGGESKPKDVFAGVFAANRK